MTAEPLRSPFSIHWPTKAGYSFASVGLSAIELMLQVFLLELYILAGLAPSMAGLAIAIAVIWDAVSDPLMGILSDKTPASKIEGKRVPFLLTGAAIIGFAFYFLFSPPVESGPNALFANLLVWYLVVNTAMTLFSVPHLSVVNDLSRSEQERATFFGWRIVAGSVGLLLGIGLPAYLAFQFDGSSIANTLELRSATGLALGLTASASCLISGLSVWRALKEKGKESPLKVSVSYRTVDILKESVRSPFFVLLVFGFMAIAVGRSFNSSLALPYYKTTLKLNEEQIGIILLVLTVFIILAAPLWVHFSKAFGKARLFFGAVISLALLSAIVYPILPAGLLWPVILLAGTGGVLVASIVLLESLFSDFVEDEKTRTSKNVSGVYYGIWRMLSKVARALGIACTGLFLSLVSYEQGSLIQAPSIERSIAWAFGPGVAVFLTAGGWCIYKTKIYHNRESQQ